MSSSAAIHEESRRPYQHMMHKIPEGIEFLFSDRLSSSVDATAKQLAAIYGLVKEKVIEEFRRLMAIKTFTADEDGTKIMPSDLMDEMWLAAIIDIQVHSPPDRITIVFVHLGGPTYSMSLPRRSTVLEVKKQIQAKRGKPVDGP